MKEFDAFISYKAEEYDDANWVRSTLENNGISCWMAPASIPGGSSYAAEIPQAIRNCKVFVLILSEKAQQSKWVPRELDQAINENKHVLPFMLENCSLKDDFNFYLSNVQRYAAYESKSKAMEKMINEIRAIIGRGTIETSDKVKGENAADAQLNSQKRHKRAKPAKPAKSAKAVSPSARNKRKSAVSIFIVIALLILIIAATFITLNIINTVTITGEKFARDVSRINLNDVTISSGDLKSFRRLNALEYLRLTDCKFDGSDLSPISKNTLKDVDLSGCNLTNEQIESLNFSEMDSLYYLNLAGNDLKSVSTLQDVSDTVKELDISNTSVSDLTGISDFTRLSTLYVDGNGISDISILKSCTTLKNLSLRENKISDLSPLSACKDLRSLDVSNNALTSLNGIEACIKLNSIWASSNAITSIDGLTNATILETVDLSNNMIEDISLLSKSSKTLNRLYIMNNSVSDLLALSDCTELQYLNIDDNEVSLLLPLSNLRNFKGLSARNNKIFSLEGINPNNYFEYLDISGNNIALPVETGKRKIRIRFSSKGYINLLNLNGNPITNLDFIAEDANIEYLFLQNTKLESYGSVYSAQCRYIIIDYDSKIDFTQFRSIGQSRYYIINCPLDRQLEIRDTLGEFETDFIEDPLDIEDFISDSFLSSYYRSNILGEHTKT